MSLEVLKISDFINLFARVATSILCLLSGGRGDGAEASGGDIWGRGSRRSGTGALVCRARQGLLCTAKGPGIAARAFDCVRKSGQFVIR